MRNDVKAYGSLFKLATNSRGRFKHNLTHSNHLGMMSGLLFPLDTPWEVLPGDTFSVKQRTIVRASNPLPTPVMDTLTFTLTYFYIPYRLVWPAWDKFIMNVSGDGTGSNYITDSTVIIPYFNLTKLTQTVPNGLQDFLGVPGSTTVGLVNILSSEAYYKTWNRWFRYESLEPEVLLIPSATSVAYDYLATPTMSYSHCISNYVYGTAKDCLCPVNRKADVFSRCLPAPARGEDVIMDLSIPSSFTGTLNSVKGLFNSDPGFDNHLITTSNPGVSYGNFVESSISVYNSGSRENLLGFSNLYGGSINSLVNAFAIFKLKQIDAQYGSRINEWTIGHYGVNVPDSRVQEPELLAWHEFDLNINQITQTSKTDGTDYLGSVGAQSITNDGNYMFTKSFNEFGLILVLGCIRVKRHTYAQGLPFIAGKKTRFDFYFNELANIPDQPLYKKSIYNNPNNVSDVFGYQEPWFEYKHLPNTVSGMMRPQYSGSYDMWTFADEYSSVPSLSATWIFEDPSVVDRILHVVQDLATPGFLVDCGFFVEAYRQVPLYSNPASLKGVL